MDDLLSTDEISALLGGGDLPAPPDLPAEDSQVLDEVAGVFASSENNVFGMLAGKDVHVRAGETVTLSQTEFKEKFPESPFVFRAAFGGFDSIPLAFVVEKRGALTLADLMMGGTGNDAPEDAGEIYFNAAQEGLSQVVGSAFTSLSGLLGGKRLMPENTSSALEAEEWKVFPSLGDDEKLWSTSTEVEIEGLTPFSMWVSIPLDSAKSIAEVIHGVMGTKESAAAQQRQAAPSAAPQMGAPAGGVPSFASPPPSSSRGAQQPGPMIDVRPAEFTPLVSKGSTPGASKIDLIADIPVRVTVELGKTRKNVSDILALTTGSVIELDKMAGEAVDVLVNGKLIAKGEVVVIDENFGVRITEVVGATKAYAM
ncbi:flagellar motor switch protein FliN [Synergistales bacterium]|nr:flagellar motor switch protein FliN [Synergistales bacterium]